VLGHAPREIAPSARLVETAEGPVVVTSHVPGAARPLHPEPEDATYVMLAAMTRAGSAPGRRHPYVESLAAVLGAAAGPVRAALGHRDREVVFVHGDLAPWNVLASDRHRAIDWEFGVPSGFPGVDAVHYHLMVDRVGGRVRPADAVDRVCGSRIGHTLGLDRTETRAVAALAAAHVARRMIEDGFTAADVAWWTELVSHVGGSLGSTG
ncbi:MAG: hypothetical protein FDZ70_07145, partial [Actinobacteria bacterium]